LATTNVDISQLSIVELNLAGNEGWDEAIQGCNTVMHVGSTFVIANPKSEDTRIVPAVEGTLRVLRVAQNAGVKRVVLTSSILAMMGNMKTGVFGPKNWTDINAANISTYTKSKTLVEKGAWDFIENQAGAAKIEMANEHPEGVFMGPKAT
jgi:dihydroflavonol-4-reductase